MHGAGVSDERKKQLDDIVQLCADIDNAVQKADWDVAGKLLSRRHQLVESVFAEPPATTADAEELKTIAEQVMAFDRELMPMADAARGEAAEELKKLRRGREAAEVYKQISR